MRVPGACVARHKNCRPQCAPKLQQQLQHPSNPPRPPARTRKCPCTFNPAMRFVRTCRQAPECSHPHLSDACEPPGTCPSWSAPSRLTVVMSWSGPDGATFRCSARIRMSLLAGARLVMFICLEIRTILACRPSCTESPAMPVLCWHDRPGCCAGGGLSVPLTSTVTPRKRCSTRYPSSLSAAIICQRSKTEQAARVVLFLHTVQRYSSQNSLVLFGDVALSLPVCFVSPKSADTLTV